MSGASTKPPDCRPPQRSVMLAGGEQFGMRALLGDAAAVEQDKAIHARDASPRRDSPIPSNADRPVLPRAWRHVFVTFARRQLRTIGPKLATIPLPLKSTPVERLMLAFRRGSKDLIFADASALSPKLDFRENCMSPIEIDWIW